MVNFRDTDFELATVNVSAWGSFRTWMDDKKANQLPQLRLIQEHKLISSEAINEAADYLASKGFTSQWTPAGIGHKGGPA